MTGRLPAASLTGQRHTGLGQATRATGRNQPARESERIYLRWQARFPRKDENTERADESPKAIDMQSQRITARTVQTGQRERLSQMPSFMVRNAQQMSDYITPLTVADAVTITDTVVKREINGKPGDGHGYFAVYGPGNDGEPTKSALYVSPEFLEGTWQYYVILEEYHPRKDGRAEIEFGKARKS